MKRGTGGSNPLPSSGEFDANLFCEGAVLPTVTGWVGEAGLVFFQRPP